MNATPPAVLPYHDDVVVIITLMRRFAGAAKKFAESVVTLTLNGRKSSATLLNTSVICAESKPDGWHSMTGRLQFQLVPSTLCPSKSRNITDVADG